MVERDPVVTSTRSSGATATDVAALGEAGYEDLLAMTQVKMSVKAKLEMARNFWDEMGRGSGKACTGQCWSGWPITSG
jgi:hypothetical protein